MSIKGKGGGQSQVKAVLDLFDRVVLELRLRGPTSHSLGPRLNSPSRIISPRATSPGRSCYSGTSTSILLIQRNCEVTLHESLNQVSPILEKLSVSLSVS